MNSAHARVTQSASEAFINRPMDEGDADGMSDVVVPKFTTPPAGYQARRDYSFLDPQHLISPSVLDKAVKYYDFNFDKLTNTNFINILDFNLNASEKRMFLVNMQSGEVKPMLAAAGVGSDPDGDGFATIFSNTPESRMSSLGFYMTAHEYTGANGRSMRLFGLEDTNNNAFKRFIVVHGADYVVDDENHAGRSFGCPAVDHKNLDDLINKTKEGSLLFLSYKP
ncbi:MAG: murein L,D-transpeptidase catalytic domain family protein [Pseudobdellovibrio sp.]